MNNRQLTARLSVIVVIAGSLLATMTMITPSTLLPVQASSNECNIGNEDEGGVFVNGEGHSNANDNGRHINCHGDPDNPPTDGGARNFKESDDVNGIKCHGVATPSGRGNVVCNTNDNKKD